MACSAYRQIVSFQLRAIGISHIELSAADVVRWVSGIGLAGKAITRDLLHVRVDNRDLIALITNCNLLRFTEKQLVTWLVHTYSSLSSTLPSSLGSCRLLLSTSHTTSVCVQSQHIILHHGAQTTAEARGGEQPILLHARFRPIGDGGGGTRPIPLYISRDTAQAGDVVDDRHLLLDSTSRPDARAILLDNG